MIAKGSQFIKLTKNVKYAEKIKSQLDDMGLVTVHPNFNNTCEGNHLNSFFKIFAESVDNSDNVAQDEMPHVLLHQKLITYISDNGSNFAQVTNFPISATMHKKKAIFTNSFNNLLNQESVFRISKVGLEKLVHDT